MNEIDISYLHRKQWVQTAMSGKTLTKAFCCKSLNIKNSKGFSWLSGKFISSNIFSAFQKLKSDVDTLWQELYSANDNKKLYAFLKKEIFF